VQRDVREQINIPADSIQVTDFSVKFPVNFAEKSYTGNAGGVSGCSLRSVINTVNELPGVVSAWCYADFIRPLRIEVNVRADSVRTMTVAFSFGNTSKAYEIKNNTLLTTKAMVVS
jgi:hypothetical protein